MLQDFSDLLAFEPLRSSEIIANLGVALLCGFGISVLYRWTYRGTSYSASFASALVTLAMITSVVMMVIGNNLARAFGLVGAMSIIRFRTAIKDTQDIAFIFLALAIGLAAGVGFHRLAILGTLAIGLTIALLSTSNYASLTRKQYLLEFYTTAAASDGAPSYLPVLKRYCRHHRLLNVRNLGDDRLALSFYVRLKTPREARAFIRDLGQTAGLSNVNLFFDEEST